MVRVKWKFEKGRVYIGVVLPNNILYYFRFYKFGLNKRFHPRQIFTRSIPFLAHMDSLIPYYTKEDGWKEGELTNKMVKEKLGSLMFTEVEFYEQISKAC